ncbi:MAG: hypothetical protein AAGF47_04910 [Planctomycetota bacterium]
MTGPALPLWLLVPPAAILMIVLAASILAMRDADMDGTRRRIRTAASLIMMLLQPLIVYLFGIGSANNPRPFVFAWAMVVGLLGILVVLAMLDVFNNTRLSRENRKLLREELRKIRVDAVEAATARQKPDHPPLRLTDDDTGRAP